MNDGRFLPPWWAAAAFALAILLLVWAMRRRSGQGPVVAVAAICAALGLTEVAAWWLTTLERVAPPTIAVDRPAPSGIILPPTILPAPGRLPGVREQRPRVLFMGDSFTEGLWISTKDSFATLVGRALDAQVINLGFAGADTEEQQLLWQHYGSTWEPDVVVWVFVLNDLHPLIPLGPDYLMRFEPGPTLGSYLLGMIRVIVAKRITQAATIEGYQRSLDPTTNPTGIALLETTLREVKAYSVAHGGRLVLAIFPLLWDLDGYPFAEGHRHIAAAAARAGAEVVDLLPAFRNEHAPDLWVSQSDHHPNAQGHAIAARPLIDVLRAGPLKAAVTRHSPPTPEQWLNEARMLRARDSTALHTLRVGMTLATAAAVLAELQGEANAAAFSEHALTFARECQDTMDNRASFQRPRSLEPGKGT